MAKTARNIGSEVLQGIREIKHGRVGRVTNFPGVANIRKRARLSQAQFARLIGVSVRTLQDWEQGRRAPSGPARALLAIAHRHPRALLGLAA